MKQFFIGFLILLLTHSISAQIDTAGSKILNNSISKQVIKNISKKPQDSTLIAVKSEDAFMPHSGKIIRHITVRHIGFEKTMYNDRTIKSRVINVANSLHSTTRESVIRDNLFIR